IRDLAEIRIAAELRRIRLGRGVRRVGVVEMDPHEPLAPLVLAPPLRRRGEDGAGAALLHDEVDGRLAFAIVVVVEIESLIEPEPRVERERSDERRARVASRTK